MGVRYQKNLDVVFFVDGGRVSTLTVVDMAHHQDRAVFVKTTGDADFLYALTNTPAAAPGRRVVHAHEQEALNEALVNLRAQETSLRRQQEEIAGQIKTIMSRQRDLRFNHDFGQLLTGTRP
jgi:hypothetical protein